VDHAYTGRNFSDLPPLRWRATGASGLDMEARNPRESGDPGL